LTHLERGESRLRGSNRAKAGPVGGAVVVGAHGSAAQDRWRSTKSTDSKGNAMRYRSRLIAVVSLLMLALAVPVALAASPRAVVYSKSTTVGGEIKGGLFAVKSGHLNQITENPADTEPAFSGDGRTIAFVRAGDLYSVRPDGSGQRQLTSGAELDSAPVVSPDGKRVVFERRAAEGAPADLYSVRVLGGGLHALTSGPADDHQADFSPDGKAIVFVRNTGTPANTKEDLYSIRPSGGALTRLTRTEGIDEFKPRWFAGGILFSRGESSEGPAAYADVYTMRRNGTRVKALVAGVGSAYVEDVSPDGHTLLFRRDQGLWSKKIGPGKARKLAQLPDGSETNGVFSSDGRKVAAFVAVAEQQSLVAIEVATRRQTELAEGSEASEKDGTVIGPVIAWQPVR
jgi:tricorn protease-like protein